MERVSVFRAQSRGHAEADRGIAKTGMPVMIASLGFTQSYREHGEVASSNSSTARHFVYWIVRPPLLSEWVAVKCWRCLQADHVFCQWGTLDGISAPDEACERTG